MNVDEMLQEEITGLHTMESGLVTAFDFLESLTPNRKISVVIVMLVEAAARHLIDLDQICEEEGWPRPAGEHPMVQAWHAELERSIYGVPPGPYLDALCVGFLRRAIALRLPCYENARLYAFHAERPAVAKSMRYAIEDEYIAIERVRNVAELSLTFPVTTNVNPFNIL